MLTYSKAFKNISDNPEVEKIMHIDNDWYLNISKMLLEMSKFKMEMEVANERDLKDRSELAKKNLEVLSKKLKYLLEHPVKIEKTK